MGTWSTRSPSYSLVGHAQRPILNTRSIRSCRSDAVKVSCSEKSEPFEFFVAVRMSPYSGLIQLPLGRCLHWRRIQLAAVAIFLSSFWDLLVMTQQQHCQK